MISGESLLLIQHASTQYKPIGLQQLIRNMRGSRGRHPRWTVKAPVHTQCVIAEGRLFTNLVTHTHTASEKPMHRIVTDWSRGISATSDQLFATPDGYKRLSELHVGDLVHTAPMPRKFAHVLPGPRRESTHPWTTVPSMPRTEQVFAILDVGFHLGFSLELEFPFSNYIANEFVVAHG